jgi:beta-galactosidase
MKINSALLFLMPAVLLAAEPRIIPDQFLFGASTYPELQTREEWNRMLDLFQKVHFKVVRVSESSWGNLETSPGKYNFGWLTNYLDDVQRHGMKAILGTSSYIAPQWLSAKHPDMLVQNQPGWSTHPMARKAACINQPLYRKAVRSYVLALGRAFKDHPAVIGWQLDNEIEAILRRPCYCPACERKWRDWLKQTYHTPAEFNKRLKLVSWGMEVDSFEDVPQPRPGGDGGLAALKLANLHFRRDCILNFLIEQTEVLREAGVTKWITTDWNTVWDALADDPLARKSLDVASLNFYQPSGDHPAFFKDLAWQLDMHRSAHGLGAFMTTETRVGVAGGTVQSDAFPTKDEFRMWMMQPAAYGAFGLMYWSGNRWTGGHWPHWGGVLDWSGHPEPDFPWIIQLGEFFEKNSERLLKYPVDASAAVLTDFDQRAALDVYGHTTSSKNVLPDVFDALHRLGIGADSMNFQDAAVPGKLSKYALVVIPAATALDGKAAIPALRQYVENGGNLVITPFTAYQSWDGLFRNDGFGANLENLTGVVTRTGRRMGMEPGRQPAVEWRSQMSPVGIDGYCEFMDVAPGVQVLGTFRSSDEVLNGRPAATRRQLGKGSVIRLAFWPTDDSALHLFRELDSSGAALIGSGVPEGVQAVPRTDKSIFIINTSSKAAGIQIGRTTVDRISGQRVGGSMDLPGYGVLWIE